MRISDWSSDVCSSDLRNIGCGMEMRDHVPPDRPIATNDEDVFHRLPRPIRAISRPAHNAGSIWRMPVASKTQDRKSTRSELQSLMRISYAVFCLKKNK